MPMFNPMPPLILREESEAPTLIDYMIRDFDGMREHITEGSRMDTTLTIVPSDFLISVNDCETKENRYPIPERAS